MPDPMTVDEALAWADMTLNERLRSVKPDYGAEPVKNEECYTVLASSVRELREQLKAAQERP